MGQESEEAAEFVATVRSEHVKMKEWYNAGAGEAGDLKQRYGPYPSLWKEVLNWPGWKESRRAYLRHQQTSSSTSTSNNNNNAQQDAAAPRRKRKSRWGGGEDDKTFIPGMPTMMPQGLNTQQQEI